MPVCRCTWTIVICVPSENPFTEGGLREAPKSQHWRGYVYGAREKTEHFEIVRIQGFYKRGKKKKNYYKQANILFL